MTVNKNTFKSLAFICLALTVSASAGAAESSGPIKLKDVQGKVMVNTGSGYVAGKSDMVLKPGYKVMVSDKGQAKILYANSCEEILKGKSLVTVNGANECNPVMIDEKSSVKTAALGDVPVGQSAAGGFSNSILVWGVGLGAAVAFGTNDSNSNQAPNASPN